MNVDQLVLTNMHSKENIQWTNWYSCSIKILYRFDNLIFSKLIYIAVSCKLVSNGSLYFKKNKLLSYIKTDVPTDWKILTDAMKVIKWMKMYRG